jgi:hypothetical protein
MAEYKRKFVFYGKEEYLAEFKLRMEYHDLSQSEFFRACVEAVIGKEDLIEDFIEDYKDKKDKGKQKNMRKKIRNERKEAEEMVSKLGLDDGEIENIFDIIAQEHPEL